MLLGASRSCPINGSLVIIVPLLIILSAIFMEALRLLQARRIGCDLTDLLPDRQDQRIGIAQQLVVGR